MRVTIEKKTDQLNFEDFLGGVTRIVTIAGVKKGTKEQQYDIAIEGDKRVWRPAVTVLKQLVDAWDDDATKWVGRRAELYGDPTVTFGRDVVGGIRISRLSHITETRSVNLTETRGKRKRHTVEPLPDAPAQVAPDPLATAKSNLWAAWTNGHDADPAALAAAYTTATGTQLADASPTDLDAFAATLTEAKG